MIDNVLGGETFTEMSYKVTRIATPAAQNQHLEYSIIRIKHHGSLKSRRPHRERSLRR